MPANISFTRTVPSSVPSLFQSSSPPLTSRARKKSVPSTFVSKKREELLSPTKMSLTGLVPSSVPSLFHNSLPRVVVNAVKNNVSPTTVKLSGANCVEGMGAVLISLSSSKSIASSRRASRLSAATHVTWNGLTPRTLFRAHGLREPWAAVGEAARQEKEYGHIVVFPATDHDSTKKSDLSPYCKKCCRRYQRFGA